MIAKADVAKIYETVLSIPGMNQPIKVTVQSTRRNLLLLHQVIEKGIKGKETDEKSQAFVESLSGETLKELSAIGYELLNKAGLTEVNEKMKSL